MTRREWADRMTRGEAFVRRVASEPVLALTGELP
jgi:hypothetical protein